jgi:hypothetical protein
MLYVIPESEFSELTVKRGELGGFVVKVSSKSNLQEAGFTKISDVISYLNVILGVSPAKIPAAANIAAEVSAKVPAGVDVSLGSIESGDKPVERRKPGPKKGSKRTPKVEQPAS